MISHFLACDLGAESGRLMLGSLVDGRLTLKEIHRWPNTPVKSGDSLHWDFEGLLKELEVGLRGAGALGLSIDGISTDGWGVDYVLFDSQNRLLLPVFHYRDPRSTLGVERVHAVISQEEVFAETGIQFMAINTLFQLAAEAPGRLTSGTKLLPIADAFNHWLSGVGCAEVSVASTTQLYNPVTENWSARLKGVLALPATALPPLVTSGTVLGPLRSELATASGLAGVQVIASCSHDTGAAVVAVPASSSGAATPDWAYLSSGTWSLLGAEIRAPLLTAACRDANFTNEIGYGNSVRLLKNIVGLWLIQECRREWASAGQEYSYAQLADLAAGAEPFRSVVDATDARFVAPGGMTGRIADFCRESHQPSPRTPAEFVRCCLESLALTYSIHLRILEELLGTQFRRLHVVGGGSRNALLNQMTADACGVSVMAGPVEATAAGNVLVQAMALGRVGSLAEAREIVARSSDCHVYNPQNDRNASWDIARQRIKGRGYFAPVVRSASQR
ncbi:MAG: rhamnulokinase [Pedosphaera sp.]|nr:rhamnulokinase [Pedosphaera sp.]